MSLGKANYSEDLPEPLRADHITSKVIREQLFKPANYEDDWRVFLVVGREGTGKSLTCASILKAVDPTFDASSIHFEPVPFLKDIGRELDRNGVAVMSDESGVGFGNRTWHDREQIEANQALQTARDYNRVMGMTAPRLEEIDSQLQGRIHVLLETVAKKDGEWVEVKWKRMEPTRTGENQIYKKYPRKSIDSRPRRITRLKIGPPPADLTESYQAKKASWKDDLFDRVIETYEDDEEETEERSAKEIAEEILANDSTEDFIGDNHGQLYIDKSLIGAEYEIGDRKSKRVKKLLQREVGDDVI